jgi:LuxR family maltose regulon positive regulatory protein
LHDEKTRRVAVEAKFLTPRLDHVSLRPDSRESLESALARRLTVVCAPAGYGKTTATAATLEKCGRTAAWYKLDVLDKDPAAFLAAMVRAVSRHNPGFGETLLRELEAGPVHELSADVLAAQFVAECDRAVAADLHIVLDDYHEAADSPALNRVLGYLLENCPPLIRFVVLTRYEPAFPLGKLRLQGDVTHLGGDLLRFDADQVADVLRRRSGQALDPVCARRLLTLTEGWPASVVLAGMALSWLDAASLGDALGDPRLRSDVFSYLAEQVLQRQDPQVQRFLLRTCCPEHVTVELAERLTGASGASRHLHHLARNHIFTFDTAKAGAYRYHNLLRDFLRQRFVQDHGDTAFHALQIETAVALEDCGDRSGAIELLLSANEPGLALDMVARGGEAELEHRPSEQLRIWVGQLSPSLEAGQPWALVTAGVLSTRESRFSSALSDLRRAAQMIEDAGDRAGLYQVLSIMEWAEFWSGDCSASMATCTRALEYADTDAQRVHTLLGLLSAALDMRRWDAVDLASDRAAALLPRARPEEAARAQALRAHAAFYQGDMRTARELIRGCDTSRQTASRRAATLNTHGMIDTALGQYESAAEHLREAADAAKSFGHDLASYMIEDNIAFLEGSTGGFKSALPRLRALREREVAPESTLFCFALSHEGTVLRRAGDVEASLYPTRLAIEAVEAHRDPYLALNAASNLTYAEGLLGAERQEALHGVSARAESAGLRFVELKALLYAAVLAGIADDSRAAVDLLERCLPQQLQLGHINLIAQELCPRPELASLVIRRHRSNGLGPPLLEALSRHWRFGEAVEVLTDRCPSQVTTWIDHLGAGRSPGATAERYADPSGRRPRTGVNAGQNRGSTALDELTAREREVLGLMARDKSNDDIARELFIALSTVKTHVNHILRKLGQTTRIGAVLEYQRLMGPIGEQVGYGSSRLHPKT